MSNLNNWINTPMPKKEQIGEYIKKAGLLREIEPFSGSLNRTPGDYWIVEVGKYTRIDFAPINGDGTVSRSFIFK